VSQRGVQGLQSPDTAALVAAGVGVSDVAELWRCYYNSCSLAVRVEASKRRGGHGLSASLGLSSAAVDSDWSMAREHDGGNQLTFDNDGAAGVTACAVSSDGSEGRRRKTRRGGRRHRPRDRAAVSVPVVSPPTPPVSLVCETVASVVTAALSGVSRSSVVRHLLVPSYPSGYSYLRVVRTSCVADVAAKLGPAPRLRDLMALGTSVLMPWSYLSRVRMSLKPYEAVVVTGVTRQCVAGETWFTSLLRTVPRAEMNSSWRTFVHGPPCCVPNAQSSKFRLG